MAKIMQIACTGVHMPADMGPVVVIAALCDDGTLWEKWGDGDWQQMDTTIPPAPLPEPAPDPTPDPAPEPTPDPVVDPTPAPEPDPVDPGQLPQPAPDPAPDA